MDLDEHMARSNARARRGRRVARGLFATAILVLLEFGLFLIAAPQAMGGGPGPMLQTLTAAGVAGILIGLAWMWRILRANPEPDTRPWRYRS